MVSRKDELRALLSGASEAPTISGGASVKSSRAGNDKAEPSANPERATSGAVKAMGLALGNLRSGAEEARQLRESLAKGEHVVELDPSLIEPAFVADRLSRAGEGDESFEDLKTSIATGGQAVPVLVRPHPDDAARKAGRYQAAYGHRRIAAAAALGIKVRAVIRTLSDEELVLAQGKENSERRNLSFIERALFCQALLARGFERRTIEAALSLHKAEMTRLLQVAEAVPRFIAEAVGPAPRAGRPRWLELAELLRSESAIARVRDEVASEMFRSATSDERFVQLLSRLKQRETVTRRIETLAGPEGIPIAAVRRSTRAVSIEISARDFAEYVASELPALHAAFLARKGDSDGQ